MIQKSLFIIFFIGLIVSTLSFNNDNLFVQPNNFPKPVYQFGENPLTKDGVELGRMLFYDAQLSRDATISCGSCHQQTSSFTQHGHVVSHGVDDQLTLHNSMPIQNLAWKKDFGWDGGIHSLDDFSISPIQKPNEMAETLPNVLEKLRKDKYYPKQFEKAFGSPEINSERFLKALSQFMLTLISANSRYDKYIRNEGLSLSETELAGLEVFKQKCASCHTGELFTDHSFRNNGLIIKDLEDIGRAEVTHQNGDKYKFVVPSLRNVTQTYPYMHDGRFETLMDVLNHYENGVQINATTDPLLKTGIKISAIEKTQLIAFLNSLTDVEFMQNLKFSETYEANNSNNNELSIVIGDWTKTDFGEVSVPVKDSLNQLLGEYFNMKNGLIQDNGNQVIYAAGRLLEIVRKIDKSQMTPLQRALFNQTYNDLLFDLKDVSTNKMATNEHQREHFTDVSKNIYKLIKVFKANKRTIFYMFCPSANANRGAYWISENNKLTNPYFGKDIGLCGKITYEVIWGNQVH